jgi:hypothetical protein
LKHWAFRLLTIWQGWQPENILLYSVTMKATDHALWSCFPVSVVAWEIVAAYGPCPTVPLAKKKGLNISSWIISHQMLTMGQVCRWSGGFQSPMLWVFTLPLTWVLSHQGTSTCPKIYVQLYSLTYDACKCDTHLMVLSVKCLNTLHAIWVHFQVPPYNALVYLVWHTHL